MSTAIELIAAERERQITAKGWTPDHDDRHDRMELALAAECYVSSAQGIPLGDQWPWDRLSYKPCGQRDPVRDLVRAGALIVAEIERLQRATGKEPQP